MALEHVCLLTKHGALPVSPEVAERDYYPQYNPRARAKNYFCTLCHQYVSLVPSGRYHAHFRHSRGEQNKECPDRADETPAYQAFLRGVHVPRLRLAWEKGASSPQFFVGLSRRILEAAIWRSLQRSVTEGFAVTIAVNGGEAMRYNAARFRADGLTELAVGSTPPHTLAIRCAAGSHAIPLPWKCEGALLHSPGAIFDAETGVFQMYDAELRCGYEYLLLTHVHSVVPQALHPTRLREDRGQRLALYRIRMTDITTPLQQELLRYPYWLTDAPLRLRPLWPVLTRDDNVLQIARQQDGREDVFFAMRARAQASVQLFAFEGKQRSLLRQVGDDARATEKNEPMGAALSAPSWRCVKALMYQNLLTVLSGRVRALDALYLVRGVRHAKADGKAAEEIPLCSVTAGRRGKALLPGVVSRLPEKGKIFVDAAYDATVRVSRGSIVVQQLPLKAGERISVAVAWGDGVEVIIGCDCVFRVAFQEMVTPPVEEGFLASLPEPQMMRRARMLVPIDRRLCEAAKALGVGRDAAFTAWWRQVMRLGHVPPDVRQKLLAAEKQEEMHHG